MYGTYGILVDFSKVNGEIPYLSSSFVLCTEILKVSFLFLYYGYDLCVKYVALYMPCGIFYLFKLKGLINVNFNTRCDQKVSRLNIKKKKQHKNYQSII